jgi:hypothetical protein
VDNVERRLKMGFKELIKKENKEEVVKKAIPKDEEKPKEVKKEKVEDKKEEKHRIVVVKELPTQVVRESVSEDGTIIHWITVEEALTQFMNQ